MSRPVRSEVSLPRIYWVGGGVLKRQGLRHGGPAYAGSIWIDDIAHTVALYRILDGGGYDCLAFNPENTASGALWPARTKLHDAAPDFIGGALIDGLRWRLRGWKDADGIRLRVKP